MNRVGFFILLIFLIFSFSKGEAAMSMTLRSSAFVEGTNIPVQNTCDGKDLSPPLQWKDAPPGVKSFALIMEDPDAPPGTWIHWVLYDIPGNANSLEEGIGNEERLKNGAKNGASWGVHEFSRVGYAGPCPPSGKPHRYYFKLYALNSLLNLSPNATKFDLEKAMKGHILAQAQIIGNYSR